MAEQMRNDKSDIRLVLAKFSHGQPHTGVGKGALVMSDLFLKYHAEKTRNPLLMCQTKNRLEDSMSDEASDVHIENGWERDHQDLYDFLLGFPETDLVITLGGDHSIAQATIFASLDRSGSEKKDCLYVIYIDAHADINTREMSLTKNIHGMNNSGIVGIDRPWILNRHGKTDILPFDQLFYYGLRSLDNFEVDVINKHGMIFFKRFPHMIKYVNCIIESDPDAKFHVSFDVDALTTSEMLSTGCPVESGIDPDGVPVLKGVSKFDVIEIINHLRKLNRLIGLDIVEFNPDIESENPISMNTLDFIIGSLDL